MNDTADTVAKTEGVARDRAMPMREVRVTKIKNGFLLKPSPSLSMTEEDHVYVQGLKEAIGVIADMFDNSKNGGDLIE